MQWPRAWAFTVKVARPGFWATSAWFYLLPLGQREVWVHPEFWLGLLYVTFPLGLLIYGWNDVVDYETSRQAAAPTAGVLGVVPAKWLMAILLPAEAALLWPCTRDWWITASLTCGALFFAADAALLWRDQPYTHFQMRFFFLGWNAVAVLSIPWVWWTATLAGHRSSPAP